VPEQSGDWLAGKQVCRKRPGPPSGHQADQKSTVHHYSKESNRLLGCIRISSCQHKSGALCPVERSPGQEKQGHTGAGAARGNKDNYKGLQHLKDKERLRGLGLFHLEKTRPGGILSMCRNT